MFQGNFTLLPKPLCENRFKVEQNSHNEFSCQQLLGHSHTRLYGLIYLKTTSEELAAPKEDLTAYRKVELLKLLSSQVPVVLEMLTGKKYYYSSAFQPLLIILSLC